MTGSVDTPRRDFWLFWGASTSSNLGDGIRVTALPLLAVTLTTDPLAIGSVTAASFAPWLLFGLIAGALADRIDRRRLILTGQTIRCVVVAGFAVLVASDAAGLVAIAVVAVAIGVGEVFVDSAMAAAIPQVAAGQLDQANSRLTSAQFMANEIVGGPLGGALFVVAAAAPFIVDAATFAVGAVLVALIAVPLQEERRDGAGPAGETVARAGLSIAVVVGDITQGLRRLVSMPVVFGLALAGAIANIADSAARVLLVLLVVNELEGSAVVFGAVLAAGAVGGFLGSTMAARVIRMLGRRRTVIAAFVVLAIGMAMVATAPSVEVVAIGAALWMVPVGVYNVAAQSIRQHLTPDELLGRITASVRLFAFGAVPIGSLGGGLIARSLGVRPTIALAGIVVCLPVVIVARATAGQDLEWRAS